MKNAALALVVLSAVSLPTPARADDTGTTFLIALGVGQIAINGLSTLTFAAVDITYANRDRKLHKAWAIPQVVFGAMSMIAGVINLAIGVSNLTSYGGDGLGVLFTAVGAVVEASGAWYVGHGIYHLATRERDDPPIAPPPPGLSVAPFFAPTRGGAVTGLALRF